MTTNERIVAIFSHPSGLFGPWVEWDDPKDYPRRVRFRGCAWMVERNLPHGWEDAYSPGDHEAHCLVEHDLRERLAGMGINTENYGEGQWQVGNTGSDDPDGSVLVDDKWGNFHAYMGEGTPYETYLDAVLSAAEAVLREWDAKKEAGDA